MSVALAVIGGIVVGALCFGLLLGLCELLDRTEETIRRHRHGRGRR